MKARREGYLLIDHRAGPGIDPSQLPRKFRADAPIAPGDRVYEAAVYLCSHCQRGVIIRPERTRERARCYKCFRIICDECALVSKFAAPGNECRPFPKLIDERMTAIAHGRYGSETQQSVPLILQP